MRSILHTFALIAVTAITCQFSSKSHAVYPAVPFNEVAQSADLIFYGQVLALENVMVGTAASTEVTFGSVETIHGTSRSLQKHKSAVKLKYAGGQVGEGVITVSDAPTFKAGHKYMVCMLDDGKNYLNPIVGGPQGYFEILEDASSGSEYVVTPTGKGVQGIADSGEVSLSASKVEAVNDGIPAYTQAANNVYQPQVGLSATGQTAPAFDPKTRDLPFAPLRVEEFKHTILAEALQKPIKEKRLNLTDDEGGKFYTMQDGKMVAHDLGTSASSATTGSLELVPTASQPDGASVTDTRGQALVGCGSHGGLLTMEQVPSSWSEYWINNDCFVLHNQFMDIFRTTDSDGQYGNNAQNEFGGYAAQSDLARIYIPGYTWGGALGVCFTYRASTAACARITQSDVFWNPAYSYTDDPALWFGTNSRYNIRATTIHEIGHAWGLQTGDAEQYNYDVPSIMHSIYSDIYETGKGLHAADVDIFRQLYDDYVSIKSIQDVGAEGYYAQDGLKKSTTNGTTFARGGLINFNNVTVENMSNTAVSNVQVKFYLSKTRSLSGEYYYVSGNQGWYFPSLSAQSFTRNNWVGAQIPTNVPPGTYYVLVDAAINGAGDAYNDNNTGVFSDQVTITAPTIGASPSVFSKNINQGQNASSDTFYVTNTTANSGALNYSLNTTYGGSYSGWLSVSPSSGSSTGESDPITITYSAAGLPAGTHTATIAITSSNATNSPRNVQVTVNVAAVPALSRSQSSFTRNITSGQNASTDSFQVWNSGNSSPMSYSISDDASWLSVSPSSGSSSGAQQSHSINYSTTGLSAGNFFGTITISAPGVSGSPTSIIVYMNVAAGASPAISCTPSSINPTSTQGQNAPSDVIRIWNSGNTNPLAYTVSDNVAWLTVESSSGVSSGLQQVHQVSYNTSSLSPGTHSGVITISAPGATNPTTTINVSLYVNASVTPTLAISPASFSKPIAQGQNAASDTLEVWNSANSTPMSYTISNNQTWLNVSPASGTASSSHQSHTVSYNTASLAVGSYNAVITVTAPGSTNSLINVPVSLVISGPTGPANDNLANASILHGVSGTVNGSSVNATKESGETNHYPGVVGGASIWWTWTVPMSGAGVIYTSGSSFDTIMGLYIGNGYPLTPISQDDDSAGNRHSLITFSATNGSTYKIAVDGFDAASGNVVLNYALTPNSSSVADWSIYN